MRTRLFALILALLPTVAAAQQYPVVGAATVIGRLQGNGMSGPSQAIPFATLTQQLFPLQSANKVYAGPTTGSPAFPTFRSLVGADLPNPSASTLGGIESYVSVAHQWINAISTSGVPASTQPAFSDISGSITPAQCPNATGSTTGCVKPDGTTITISSGIITAVGATATAVDAAGATSVTNCGSTEVVLYNTSSSKVGCTGSGTTGQALVSNGSSSPPTFQSGQRVLLNTLTASSSATLSDTTSLTSAFNEYDIVFENLLPASNGVQLELQVHSGGAFKPNTYLATSAAFATTTVVANPTTFFPLSSSAACSSTVPGFSGMLTITTPSGSSAPKVMTSSGTCWNGTNSFLNLGGGFWNSNGAVDGFQVLFSTGNIASGTIKIYGRL